MDCHETLSRLASLQTFEGLSSTPGWFNPQPVIQGDGANPSIYVRNSLLCDYSPEEFEKIKSVITLFLEENATNFNEKDLPKLALVENRLKQLGFIEKDKEIMHADDTGNEFLRVEHPSKDPIYNAIDRIYHRFLSNEEIPREESEEFFQPGEGSFDLEEDSESFFEAEGESEETSEEIAKLTISPSLDLLETTEPIGIEESSSIDKLLGKTETIQLIEYKDLLHTYPKEYMELNTAWFLQKHLEPDQHSSCETFINLLYEQSKNDQKSLHPEEWLTLARGLDILLQNQPSDTGIINKAEDVFLRFYLQSGDQNALPEEFASLYQKLQNRPAFNLPKGSDLNEKLDFVRPHVAVKRAEGDNLDPNRIILLKNLNRAFLNSNLESCDFELRGFASTKPWRVQENDTRRDTQILVAMAHDLAKRSDLSEHLMDSDVLNQICLVMAFALQRQYLKDKEFVGFKQDLLLLEKQFSAIEDAIAQKSNQVINQAEYNRFRNFQQLYKLFKSSNFVHRMEAEEANFSLWGFIDASHKTLVGNIHNDFDLHEMTAKLNNAKMITLQGEKKAPQNKIKEFSIKSREPIVLAAPQDLPSWDTIFSEIPMDINTPEGKLAWQESWKQQTEKTKEQAERLINHYKKNMGIPIDFSVLLNAIQQGKLPPRFLEIFKDQGVALLKDYIYPYAVMRIRSKTSHDAISAKFISFPASSHALAQLGGNKPEQQVALLCNAVYLMRSGGEKGKGPLNSSAIHNDQLSMLQKMISAIKDRKPQTIFSDTGSGKTFTSKLASQLIAIDVPAAIHVAPFPSTDEGWTKLVSWEDLKKGLDSGKAPHFWITTDELKKLLKQPIPQEIQAVLKDSLFYMDEYDSPHYLYEQVDESGRINSLQNDLYFSFGCGRVVNMSATNSIEEIESKIARYQLKNNQTPKPEYQKRIAQLTERRDKLIKNIQIELSREIAIKPAAKPIDAQIEQIFSEINKQKNAATQASKSFLIELPDSHIHLSSPALIKILEQTAKVFQDTPSAVLLRDEDGSMKAFYRENAAQNPILMSLDDFVSKFDEMEKKPQVICLYTQDSVGGDFLKFSNEMHVGAQFIVYEGEKIVPTNVLYQNMRRQRSKESIAEKRSVSPTPFIVYVSDDVSQRIHSQPSSPTISTSGSPETSQDLKLSFLFLANEANKDLSDVSELNRLEVKVSRKKQKLFEGVMLQDLQRFKNKIKESFPDEEMETFASNGAIKLETLLMEALRTTKVKANTNLEELRKDVWANIIPHLTVPAILEPRFGPSQLQTYYLIDWLSKTAKMFMPNSSDPKIYDQYKKFLNQVYSKRGTADNVLDIWTNALRIYMKDPSLTKDTVAGIFRKFRKQDVPFDSALKIESFLPDRFIKATLGQTTTGNIEVQKFLKALAQEKEKVDRELNDYDKFKEENSQRIEIMKIILNQSSMPAIQDLSQEVAALEKNLAYYNVPYQNLLAKHFL